MIKEAGIILLLIGLPTVFILTLGNANTGALVNDLVQLRNNRIQLYLDFPITLDVHKTTTYRIRKHLLDGAYDQYYYPYGMSNGDLFFLNELTLFGELLKVMCTQQIRAEEYFTSAGRTITLPNDQWTGVDFESIGIIPCNPELAAIAEETLQKAIEYDTQLVQITIDNSRCKAEESMELARQNYEEGKYEAMLTNLRSAWSQAQC